MAVKKTNPVRSDRTFARSEVYKLSFKQLKVINNFNIRYDYGDIDELAASIEQNGVLQPLHGYREGDVFIITDGFRRYKALEMLHKKGVDILVPLMPEVRGTNEETRVLNMFVKNGGKPLTPLEQAEGIRRLLAYKWTEKEIADRLAKSPAYINKLNLLNKAPKQLTVLIQENIISATFAIEKVQKNEVEQFLTDYDKGEFTASSNGKNENTLFGEMQESLLGDKKTSGKQAKITKKQADADKVNSVKEFKGFIKTADKSTMSVEKKKVYEFFTKLFNNEISIDQIKRFFK